MLGFLDDSATVGAHIWLIIHHVLQLLSSEFLLLTSVGIHIN